MNSTRRTLRQITVAGMLAAALAPATRADDGFRARNALPPGQSGFISAEGPARGKASGTVADSGAHLDDQRNMYWNYRFKPGNFTPATGEHITPREGVRIYRTPEGVPAIYAEEDYDLWFGVGYAIAQDRLFLMDAVRRMGRGTFAELTGCSGIPADIQQRTVSYTDEEYQAIFEALSDAAKDSITGYVAGANAWIDTVVHDPLNLLPAEYALLSTIPEPLSVIDALAASVLITRTVASEGGNEFQNVALLRELESRFGRRDGRRIFNDFVWQDDPKAITTVPAVVAGSTFLEASSATRSGFSNNATPTGQRDDVFHDQANYAARLPMDLASGAGTGAIVAPCEAPPDTLTPQQAVPGAATAQAPGQAEAAQQTALQEAVAALNDFRARLQGGSFGLAISPQRTADNSTMLVSAPQLGYSYPSLLVELEIHGRNYDARGVSVPALPTVGIGYNRNVAWALTAGYSKTIDSFVETVRRRSGQVPEYFHNDRWHEMQCRTEQFHYRSAQSGLPEAPDILTVEHQICRANERPVVAWSDEDPSLARSVKYAMWKQEILTVEGILGWNKARNLNDFIRATAQVTWNENVTYAGSDGHIAYFHPGVHYMRSPASDQRLPKAGTGEYDDGGRIPFADLPHVIDPAQGFVANWNNKPAVGWVDGEGISPTSRPGGGNQRVRILTDLLGSSEQWKWDDLLDLEVSAGTNDVRARAYLPLMLKLLKKPIKQLGIREHVALLHLKNWDHRHYSNLDADPDDNVLRDGAAATIFDYYVQAIRDALYSGLPKSLQQRQSGVGSHVFDMSVADNLAIRVLSPASSGLRPRYDYLGERGPDELLMDALRVALRRLADNFESPNPDHWQRQHPRSEICSLTGGVVGPCGTMPYQDRGSWVHHVQYPAASGSE